MIRPPNEISIIKYPHPTLRYRSCTIQRVDRDLREVASRMFQLMYEAEGIGLAANQIDLPLRMFVMNLAGNPHEGEERVFLNPVLRLPRGTREKQEGCLSLPGVYANVRRPEEVILHAFELSGDEFEQRIDGMFARVVQHEIDHLNGVLFIDHLDEESLDEVTPSLKQFTQEFSDAQREQRLPSDAHIAEMRAAWEQRYG